MRRIVVIAVVLAACTACGAGPSTRPDVAVVQHQLGVAGATTTSAAPDNPAPPIEMPKSDLSWSDCTRSTLDRMHLGAGPAGLKLQCASVDVELDPGNSLQSFSLDALRASTPATPGDAAPVVLAAGTDRPATDALAQLATGPHAAILRSHPVVALDRRGIGGSGTLDCLTSAQRASLTTLADPTAPAMTQALSVLDTSKAATVACTDQISPAEQGFDALHAASDLDTLRRRWGVDRLALLTTGDGAAVALTYAAKVPNGLSRLVLDSPAPSNADTLTAAEQRIQGEEAALTAFVAQCASPGCPLGADPRAAVTDLLGRARAGTLPSVSVGALLTTIAQRLADPTTAWADRVTGLADLLARAGHDDPDALHTIASAVALTDGQFVAQCSDAPASPAAQRAVGVEPSWSSRYPDFGDYGMGRMLTCGAWPAHAAPPLPSTLPIPVLMLGGAADPVVGGGGPQSLATALNRVGTKTATVSWQGAGHPVLWNSDCAGTVVGRYLDSGALPAGGTACPA
ncbi:alpha/beta hydrolase [Corynebacteriales bacterium D3-21]|uniref:Alpha/beta hydrolase n=1 Tax=Speluncibacter jeojiensis TaxID=2710754 RepID=A0A9X4M624_9ACTN|nr:alpha/beta hydrolase [Corynebacteriales bacterium D3-21]